MWPSQAQPLCSPPKCVVPSRYEVSCAGEKFHHISATDPLLFEVQFALDGVCLVEQRIAQGIASGQRGTKRDGKEPGQQPDQRGVQEQAPPNDGTNHARMQCAMAAHDTGSGGLRPGGLAIESAWIGDRSRRAPMSCHSITMAR